MASVGGASSRGEENDLEVTGQGDALKKLSFLEEVEQGLYGFLFTMVQKKESSSQLPYLILVIDVFQFWTLSMNTDVPWGLETLQSTLVSFQSSGAYFGFVSYVAVLAGAIMAVLVAYFNAYWVGQSFKNGSFSRVWPVKSLRFLVTLLVTVGFIPTVNVLLISLSCVEQDGARVWRFLPEVSCWAWPTLLASVLSIVTLVIFVPFALLMSLVYFDPRPRSSNPAARPSGRLSFMFVGCKTIVAMIFSLLPGYIIVKACVYCLATYALFAAFFIMVPYYHNLMNTLAISLFTMLAFSGTMTVACCAVNDPTNVYFLPSLLLGMLVALPLGWVIGVKRLAYLRAKAFQYAAAIEAEENVIGDNADANRQRFFSRPSSVEVYARFVAQKRKVEGSLWSTIFKRGTRDFPQSSEIVNAFAMYVASYEKNHAYASNLLKQARSLGPPFDVRFMIYCRELETVQEQQSRNLETDKIDVVSYVEFRKNYMQAKMYHARAVEAIKRFWDALRRDVDIHDIPTLTNAITNAERPADAAYRQLIVKFPQSTKLLGTYALFLEEVKRDYKGASAMRARLSSLNEDNGGEEVNVVESQQNAEAVARHTRYRNALMSYKSEAVHRLSVIIIVAMLLLAAVISVSFILVANWQSLSVTSATSITLSRVRATQLHKSLAANRNLINAHLDEPPEYSEAAYYRGVLRTSLEDLRHSHRELFNKTYPMGDAIDMAWRDQSIPVSVLHVPPTPAEGGVGKSHTWLFSLWDAGNHFIDQGMGLASMASAIPASVVTSSDIMRFLFNSAGTLPVAVMDVSELYVDFLSEEINRNFLTQAILSGAGLAVLVVLGVGFFSPALKEVRHEHYRTLNIIVNIPKDVVENTYNALTTNEAALDESGVLRDVHQINLNQTQDFISHAQSNSIAVNSEDWKTSTDKKAASRTDHFSKRMTRQYKGALFLIAVFIIASALVHLLIINNRGYEIDASTARASLVERIHWLSRELIAPQNSSVIAAATTREWLAQSSELLKTLHLGLKVGDESLNLRGVGQDTAMATLMYETACLIKGSDGCEAPGYVGNYSTFVPLPAFPGLDAAVSKFIELANLAGSPAQPQEEVFEQLRALAENGLVDALMAATELYTDDFKNVLAVHLTLAAGLFTLSVVNIVCLYFFLFRRMLASLRRESIKTKTMLLMIPPEALDELDEVREFLEAGCDRDALALASAVQESDADCVIVISGVDGRVRGAVRGHEEILGEKEEELKGAPFVSIFADSPFGTNPKANLAKLKEISEGRRVNVLLRHELQKARMAALYSSQANEFRVLIFAVKGKMTGSDDDNGDLNVPITGFDGVIMPESLSVVDVVVGYSWFPVIIAVSTDGQVMDANARAIEYFGYADRGNMQHVGEVLTQPSGVPLDLVPSRETVPALSNIITQDAIVKKKERVLICDAGIFGNNVAVFVVDTDGSDKTSVSSDTLDMSVSMSTFNLSIHEPHPSHNDGPAPSMNQTAHKLMTFLLGAAPDALDRAVLLCSVDDRTVLCANRTATVLLECPVATMVGMRVSSLVSSPDWSQYAEPMRDASSVHTIKVNALAHRQNSDPLEVILEYALLAPSSPRLQNLLFLSMHTRIVEETVLTPALVSLGKSTSGPSMPSLSPIPAATANPRILPSIGTFGHSVDVLRRRPAAVPEEDGASSRLAGIDKLTRGRLSKSHDTWMRGSDLLRRSTTSVQSLVKEPSTPGTEPLVPPSLPARPVDRGGKVARMPELPLMRGSHSGSRTSVHSQIPLPPPPANARSGSRSNNTSISSLPSIMRVKPSAQRLPPVQQRRAAATLAVDEEEVDDETPDDTYSTYEGTYSDDDIPLTSGMGIPESQASAADNDSCVTPGAAISPGHSMSRSLDSNASPGSDSALIR